MNQTKLRASLRRLLLAGMGSLLVFGMIFTLTTNTYAAAPDQSAQAQSTVTRRAVVRGGGAELRAQPGGEILADLRMATALTATGRTADNAWIQVEAGDQGSGWVQTNQVVIFGLERLPIIDVEIIPLPTGSESQPAVLATPVAGQSSSAAAASTPAPDTTANSQTATVDTGARRLNVRAGPGTNYGIVGNLASGTNVQAVGRNDAGSWIQIQLPQAQNEIGWVSASFVDLSGAANDLPVSSQLSQARILANAAAAASTSARSSDAGKMVFQQRSGGDIYLYDVASGNLKRLTSGLDPALSPDGKTIVFARDGGADRGIYLIGADGGNERRIYAGGVGYRAPKWSPDGQRIVYSRVIGKDACREVYPGICIPDAPYLGQFPLKERDVWGLSSIDANGGDFRDVRASNDATASAWTNQGIVYQSRAGIERTNPDNSTEPWLILDDGRYQDPDWSRDGSRIVFHSLEKDHRELFSANSDGSGLVALTQPPSSLITEPVHNVAAAWSPDGKQIAFLSNRSGPWALYVMNADGSNPRKLPIDIPIEYNFQGEQVVSWSQ
ncbi:MAG: PD40 domain-containing protein [Caldilineales bacterium]|nr:PD40 domain-containing protein [Caldilineales bacterium]